MYLKTARFAQELLGFQLREQVVFDHGKREIGSWMSPTAVHHQLAYVLDVKGGHGRLHHFSLWVDNREDVRRAADILTENGIFIEAGPAKHNNSQGFYLYSYERVPRAHTGVRPSRTASSNMARPKSNPINSCGHRSCQSSFSVVYVKGQVA
jgi:catechol 2,3-dioxygenase-like lactoylglutathione lyase family enzyme